MTQEELLERIAKLSITPETNVLPSELATALMAVVELHQEYTTADGVAFCVKCCTKEEQLQYPCPTIQAIENELK